MKLTAFAFLTIILTFSAMAKDNCRSPDCSWLNTKNGKLYADGPLRHGVSYHWKGWAAYSAMLCEKYGKCEECRDWAEWRGPLYFHTAASDRASIECARREKKLRLQHQHR